MASVAGPMYDEHPSPAPRSSGRRAVLSAANRALQVAVPAYGLAAAGTWLENRNARVKTRFNGSGFLGGLLGIALSGALSLGVDSLAYPVVAQADAPGTVYTQQVARQEPLGVSAAALGLVSPFAYAADAFVEDRGLETKLTVTFEDGADRGAHAQCTYGARGVVPIAELDALGRPVRITYRGEEVPDGSLVGSTIETRCEQILAAQHGDLADSFRYLGQ